MGHSQIPPESDNSTYRDNVTSRTHRKIHLSRNLSRSSGRDKEPKRPVSRLRSFQFASLPIFWTCTQENVHEDLDGHNVNKPSAFFVGRVCACQRGKKPSRRRPRVARRDPRGCAECWRFPLRVWTNVYHDQCRPEVAAEQHRRPFSCLWVGSLCRREIARRLPGRHSSVAASPLRCGTGLLVGQYLGKTTTWCPQVVSLPAGTCWTRELKWTLVKRVGTRGQDPRLCRSEHATTGAVQTPGPRPVTLSSEGRPLLAVRGSFWGPAEVSSHVLWIACGRLPLRGVQKTGQSAAPQSCCPGSSWRQGSHLPYISTGLLRQQRHLTIRKVPGWHVVGVRSATEVAVRAWLEGSPVQRPAKIWGIGPWPRESVSRRHQDNPQ